MKGGVLFAVAILLFAAFLNFRGIDREKYENDEALWILQGQKYWPLFSSGQWDRREWNDFDSSWGTPNPPVAKYLLGCALAAQHVQWKWDGSPPPANVLAAARASSAIAGVLGCAGILIIGFLALSQRAALYSGLLLATSPTWISASRHAMTDIYGASLAILSVVPFLLALKEMEKRRRALPIMALLGCSGLMAGLAVGAKLNAASTPVAAGIVLLILVIGEVKRMGSGRNHRAWLLLVSGIVYAIAAMGIFVLLNLHLHEDTWGRFAKMIDWWTRMTEQRVASAEKWKLNAFDPEGKGLRVFFGKLFMLPKWIALLLLLPLIAAILARRRSGSSRSSSRLIIWTLLLAIAVLLGWWPNQILHSWLFWFGCIAAALALVLFGKAPAKMTPLRLPVFAIVVWGIVCAFFVWRMTFIPWLRYYLPVLPWLALLAGFGLSAFRDDLRATFGPWPARLVDAALIFGSLSVAATFPDYGAARMQNMSLAGGTTYGILLGLTIASLAAAILTSFVQARRAVIKDNS
ncbi:MAG TPA: hypothetical protein VFR10_12875 [bacterium]|nr:hypothetical protein [bacterium]